MSVSAFHAIYVVGGDVTTSCTNTITTASGNVIVVFADDPVSKYSASTSLLQPAADWVLPRLKPRLPDLGHEKRGAEFERRRNGFQQFARLPCYRSPRTR